MIFYNGICFTLFGIILWPTFLLFCCPQPNDLGWKAKTKNRVGIFIIGCFSEILEILSQNQPILLNAKFVKQIYKNGPTEPIFSKQLFCCLVALWLIKWWGGSLPMVLDWPFTPSIRHNLIKQFITYHWLKGSQRSFSESAFNFHQIWDFLIFIVT